MRLFLFHFVEQVDRALGIGEGVLGSGKSRGPYPLNVFPSDAQFSKLRCGKLGPVVVGCQGLTHGGRDTVGAKHGALAQRVVSPHHVLGSRVPNLQIDQTHLGSLQASQATADSLDTDLLHLFFPGTLSHALDVELHALPKRDVFRALVSTLGSEFCALLLHRIGPGLPEHRQVPLGYLVGFVQPHVGDVAQGKTADARRPTLDHLVSGPGSPYPKTKTGGSLVTPVDQAVGFAGLVRAPLHQLDLARFVQHGYPIHRQAQDLGVGQLKLERPAPLRLIWQLRRLAHGSSIAVVRVLLAATHVATSTYAFLTMRTRRNMPNWVSF